MRALQARLPPAADRRAATGATWCSAAPSRRWSASLALVPRLGSEFLPELNEGAIWVNLDAAAGHLGERGVAELRARPRDCCGSSRKCAR